MKACRQLCPWNTLYGCKKPESEPCILSNMACEKFEPKPQTNADHIRSMTDEELATLLSEVEYRRSIGGGGAIWFDDEGAMVWLKQPYKEDA